MPNDGIIPLEVRRNFEELDGAIPLDVVSELLDNAKVGAEAQAAFWASAALKDVARIDGHVGVVKTNRDGTSEVVVIRHAFGLGALGPALGLTEFGRLNRPLGAVTFHVPSEMTEEQLAELKRAQVLHLRVGVEYQIDARNEKYRKVNATTVFPLPASP